MNIVVNIFIGFPRWLLLAAKICIEEENKSRKSWFFSVLKGKGDPWRKEARDCGGERGSVLLLYPLLDGLQASSLGWLVPQTLKKSSCTSLLLSVRSGAQSLMAAFWIRVSRKVIVLSPPLEWLILTTANTDWSASFWTLKMYLLTCKLAHWQMGKPRHKIYLVQDYIAEGNRAGLLNDFLNGVKFYKLSWNTVTRLLCYQLLIGAHLF